MEEIKITKEMFKDVEFEVEFPECAGWIVPCDCGSPYCTGEKVIYKDSLIK